MILLAILRYSYVPEVNSKKFYSFTCYFDIWGYENNIDGSSVGNYIKRK